MAGSTGERDIQEMSTNASTFIHANPISTTLGITTTPSQIGVHKDNIMSSSALLIRHLSPSSSDIWTTTTPTTPSKAFVSTGDITTPSEITSASTTPQLEMNEKLPSYVINNNKNKLTYAQLNNQVYQQQQNIGEESYKADAYISYPNSNYYSNSRSHSRSHSRSRSHSQSLDDTDNTVIHRQYPGNKINFLEFKAASLVEMDDFEGNTKRNLTIEDIVDNYIQSLEQSEIELNNEIYLAFEEFKFDVITDHLSLPVDSTYNRTISTSAILGNDLSRSTTSRNTSCTTIGYFDYYSLNELEENLFIKLSDTPYLLLLHSIRPKLTSFSIFSFIRKNISKLNKKCTLALMSFAVSILNMTDNSSKGLKLYSRMLILRTKKMTTSLLNFESYLLKLVTIKGNQFRKYNNITNNHSKQTRLNLISSSLHLLISVFVKRIGKMITYVSNIGSLWKYIAVYGLDGDFDEVKLVRNIVENPSACSCTWLNDPIKLIRTLQYVRKVLLCVIMSSMEVDEIEITDNENAILFMKNFWSKFGFDNIKWNIGSLTFATRLLGMSSCLDEFTSFINNLKNEIIDDTLPILHESNYFNPNGETPSSFSTLNMSDNAYKLDIVNERNEDERIRTLSSIVDRIGYKLDLVEIGMDNSDEGLLSVKNDIDALINCYNEVTSGTSLITNSTNTKNRNELKKLRMSEILLDEFNESSQQTAEKKQKNRRSSGFNVKLFSVVKSEETNENDQGKEKEKEKDKDNFNNNKQEFISEATSFDNNSEFRKTLEKLCLSENSNLQITPNNKFTASNKRGFLGKENEDSFKEKLENEDVAFLQFKKELKHRLEEEGLKI